MTNDDTLHAARLELLRAVARAKEAREALTLAEVDVRIAQERVRIIERELAEAR